MALLYSVLIPGGSVATYNLHCESKGSDSLRYSQLDEFLQDAKCYRLDVPVIAAGDSNFDLSQGKAAAALADAGFRSRIMWNRAGFLAIKLSTTSALLVCFVVAGALRELHVALFDSPDYCGLFIAAMFTSIVSLTLFLREVYFAIETFEIALPVGTRQKATDRHMHATQVQK